jgi:rod shape determining protein RodA
VAGRSAVAGSAPYSRALQRIDWWLLLSAGILLFLGLAALYSVSQAPRYQGVFQAQIVRVAIGIVPFLVFFLLPPGFWKKHAWLIYIFNVALLAAVRWFGTTGGGAQRWVELGPIEFQPSEMSKVFLALSLAAFFAGRRDSIDKFSTFALSFAHVLIPAILVFMQPHLGATVVLLVIWLSISIVAGVPAKFIVVPILAVLAIFAIGFFVPGILKDYQKERVRAMWSGNEQDDAYQSTRAQIAFGVGGLHGTGYLKGEQKEGGHIPEQQTDFIFTVVGEEGGFVGATLVVLAFGFFLYRGWLVMFRCVDPFAKMVAAGIIGALAFHTIVNLFMNVQLLPVVGLWLPFFSFGGTAMWMCLSCVGLLLSLRRHERPLLF